MYLSLWVVFRGGGLKLMISFMTCMSCWTCSWRRKGDTHPINLTGLPHQACDVATDCAPPTEVLMGIC